MAQWARRKRRTRVTSLQELAWLHREEIEIGEVVTVAACDMGRLQTQLTGLGIGVSTEWQREQIMNENQVWTIERTPGANWIAESVRHLSGEENHGNHHVYVDAEGPDGADLRNTGLNIFYGWDGIRDDEATPLTPINKPAGEFGCNVPIFSDTDMYIGMHGAPSDIVRGLRTDFGDNDGQDGNSWGHQSFHVVFRYQPTPAEPEAEPQARELLSSEPQAQPQPVPAVAEPAEAEPAERPVREPAERQDTALKWEYHAENGAERSYFTATVTDQVVAWVIETDSGAGHAIAYLADSGNHRLTPIQLLNGVDEAKTWAETRAQKFTRTAELPQQSE
jgi:hypothetical protein